MRTEGCWDNTIWGKDHWEKNILFTVGWALRFHASWSSRENHESKTTTWLGSKKLIKCRLEVSFLQAIILSLPFLLSDCFFLLTKLSLNTANLNKSRVCGTKESMSRVSWENGCLSAILHNGSSIKLCSWKCYPGKNPSIPRIHIAVRWLYDLHVHKAIKNYV